MGYRLHVTIPNVPNYDSFLELGKQYNSKWNNFNNKWFGENRDEGLIDHEDIIKFYKEYIKINDKVGDYKLYNTDKLKKLLEYALKNKYSVYFVSF
jgi:hypothetical protein